jgi:uncharacterized protein (TIGR02118 family)
MFQFTTIYYRVDDEEKLENFFSSTHLQLAEQLPGLVKSEVSRIMGKPGGESRFHMAYSLYFATEASFQISLVSDAGIKLVEALKPWAEAGLLVWYYADSFEEVVRRARPEVSVEDLLPDTGDRAGSGDQLPSAEDAAGM